MEKIRRYDLDWLRVIVFGLLIFYHVGMFFVPWDWHIKNQIIYGWLTYPMLFINQWRLPILFLISGMGTAYALAYRSGGEFVTERLKRLGIPLIFGILIIVPPQVYVERIYAGGFSGSFVDWYTSQAFAGIYPQGNFSWHHLWFLPYLLVFSLVLAPMFLKIRAAENGKFLNRIKKSLQANPWFLFYFIIPLYLYEALLEPFFEITHNLVWDWFNFVSSLTLFFYGFLLIKVKEVFWQVVDKIKAKTLLLGIVTFTSLMIIWLFLQDSLLVHFTEALLKVANLWTWIITILGYAAKYLKRPGKYLAYCNQAVYPFYILHQTVTVVIGYFIYEWTIGLAPKFLILVVGTFSISWLIYEFLIRRVPLLGPVFGLKRKIKSEDVKPHKNSPAAIRWDDSARISIQE
ncbi:MAG: acyltransferase family protein [Candidatus Cyclobacteriaceae bacterium M3_2C_046]